MRERLYVDMHSFTWLQLFQFCWRLLFWWLLFIKCYLPMITGTVLDKKFGICLRTSNVRWSWILTARTDYILQGNTEFALAPVLSDKAHHGKTFVTFNIECNQSKHTHNRIERQSYFWYLLVSLQPVSVFLYTINTK